MSPIWQKRFLTWGIWIAVFGMRLVFPIAVVSIFAHLGFIDVINMALKDPDKYAHYLHISHPPIITFGASFLIMLFFTFFLNINGGKISFSNKAKKLTDILSVCSYEGNRRQRISK